MFKLLFNFVIWITYQENTILEASVAGLWLQPRIVNALSTKVIHLLKVNSSKFFSGFPNLKKSLIYQCCHFLHSVNINNNHNLQGVVKVMGQLVHLIVQLLVRGKFYGHKIYLRI